MINPYTMISCGNYLKIILIAGRLMMLGDVSPWLLYYSKECEVVLASHYLSLNRQFISSKPQLHLHLLATT